MEEDIPLPKTQINPSYFLVSIRLSKCYIYFHVVQIILTFALLVSLVAHLWDTTPFLEIIVSLLLSIDLLIKYLSEGQKTFVEGIHNCIDVFVLIMLFTIVIADLFYPQSIHNSQGILSLTVLGASYLIQIWRVFELSKQSKYELEVNKTNTIMLNNCSEDETFDIYIN